MRLVPVFGIAILVYLAAAKLDFLAPQQHLLVEKVVQVVQDGVFRKGSRTLGVVYSPDSESRAFLDAFLALTNLTVVLNPVKPRNWKVRRGLFVSGDVEFIRRSLAGFDQGIFEKNGNYIVCGTGSYSRSEIREVFEEFWARNVANVAFLQEANETFTFYPYSRDSCNQPEVVRVAPAEAFADKYSNFHGCPLKVATILLPPFIISTTNGSTFTGIEGELLLSIAKKLNFSPKLILNSEWGQLLPNGSITEGMMTKVLRREADLTLGMFTVVEYRAAAMDLSVSYMPLGHAFVVSPEAARTPKLTEPFTPQLWAASVAVLMAFGWLGLVMKTVGRNPFLAFFGLVFGNGLRRPPSQAQGRLVLGLWLFFSFFLINSYLANYFRFLTQSGQLDIPDSIEEMIRRNYTFYLRPFNTFYKDYPKINVQFPRVSEGWKLIDRMSDPDFKGVMVMPFFAVNGYNRGNKSKPLHVSKQSGVSVSVVIFYPRGSPLREVSDPVIGRLRDTGLIQHWITKFRAEERLETVFTREPMQPLTLSHFSEVLVALTVGYLTALVIFVVEVTYKRLLFVF